MLCASKEYRAIAESSDRRPEDPLVAGLTSAEANRRLSQFGANTTSEDEPTWLSRFAGKFWSPIAWMLEIAILVQVALGHDVEALLIVTLLAFNAALGLVQESRAGAALKALKSRLAASALVLRDSAWTRIPASRLVPDDAIRLPLGSLIPADATLVSGTILADQSMLTGESVPVEAGPGDSVFAGSIVRHGQAIARVTATGAATFFGRAAELVRTAHGASTEQAAIFSVTRSLIIVNGSIAALIVAASHFMALPLADEINLALTALLATIPAALPATFTLSAASSAQTLAKRGVLLTRLSAAHEAAAMDVLCVDKTGTLTRNALNVIDVIPAPGFDQGQVLELAALASSESDQDSIDVAVRTAASTALKSDATLRPVRFIPFDPATKLAEAIARDPAGNQVRIVKGALEAIAKLADVPLGSQNQADALARQGHRVIAVATGTTETIGLAGFIVLGDPPRDDSAGLVADLYGLGVRPVMVTGDSTATAVTIARLVGIRGAVSTATDPSEDASLRDFGIFARIVPEEKFRLIERMQSAGNVVGMCGDGVNDAPALRQAQIGIAVSTASDAAKAAAGMVLTEPGLAGIVHAIREGRIGFQRLLTYTFNMMTKKIEIALFLALGLVITGQAILTPALMVLMLMTNDFLAMSLTADRATPTQTPNRWRLRNVTAAALVLGVGKLEFSVAALALGKFWLGLNPAELQSLALLILVFGAQALIYVVRERRSMWSSRPSKWVLASSVIDIGLVSTLALSGTIMTPLPADIIAGTFAAAAAFALVLDLIKKATFSAFGVK